MISECGGAVVLQFKAMTKNIYVSSKTDIYEPRGPIITLSGLVSGRRYS